jgi:hypothetical protein
MVGIVVSSDYHLFQDLNEVLKEWRGIIIVTNWEYTKTLPHWEKYLSQVGNKTTKIS